MKKPAATATPPAEKPDATENVQVKRTLPVTFWMLKHSTCKKLGRQSVGGISDEFLADRRKILWLMQRSGINTLFHFAVGTDIKSAD